MQTSINYTSYRQTPWNWSSNLSVAWLIICEYKWQAALTAFVEWLIVIMATLQTSFHYSIAYLIGFADDYISEFPQRIRPRTTPQLDYDVSFDDDAASSLFFPSIHPSNSFPLPFPSPFSISIVEKPSGQLPGQSVVGREGGRVRGAPAPPDGWPLQSDGWLLDKTSGISAAQWYPSLSRPFSHLSLVIVDRLLLWGKCAEFSGYVNPSWYKAWEVLVLITSIFVWNWLIIGLLMVVKK